jgi:hypothetical protein
MVDEAVVKAGAQGMAGARAQYSRSAHGRFL